MTAGDCGPVEAVRDGRPPWPTCGHDRDRAGEETDPQDGRLLWLTWAAELQSLAQAGLWYGKDPFDRERYERIRQIAAEMVSAGTSLPLETVRDLFCGETGYQTPKIDTRAAVVREDGAVLLVRERDGRWALPGGWCDFDRSPAENAVKEAREEAGMDVSADLLIAVQDRDRHNAPRYAWKIVKLFFLCTARGGDFVPNTETTERGYFFLDELPPLAEEKCTAEQIALCVEASRSEDWRTRFE